MSSQSVLLRQRRFLPLFVTQFLGALNDNVLKNALVVLLAFDASTWTSLSPEVLTNLAAGIFILPFFLFSATAGQLADKFDKARLARLVKVLEMGIMLVAGAGFALHSLAVLLCSLFLLGLHSTLFGPIKYAILPQHLKDEELVGGNALIEAGTFVAILVGTLVGGLLAGTGASGPAWITATGLCLAAVGYMASRSIPAAPAPEPGLRINPNLFAETWRNIASARKSRTVFLSILGISWFWLYGALLLAQFPAYARNVLGGGETGVTLLLAVFTTGIGLGSLACERLSAGRVEIGLVPLGAFGLTLFGLDLALASPATVPAGAPLGALALLAAPDMVRVLADLVLLGVFGGFFIVPLYALVQQRADEAQRARIIAANNILNALFMVAGALAAAALLSAGLSIPALFAVAALCNAAVALYIFRLVPEFLLRFLAWLLVRCVYRLETLGLEHIPERGPALLVCNHVGRADALIVMAACRRPIRFVVDHRSFSQPLLRFIFGASRAVPIAPARDDEALREQALDEAAAALRAGELVGVFPEGGITQDGALREFRTGYASILERVGAPVPVVPVALCGLCGSFFSHKGGAAMTMPFRRGLFSKIGLTVGEPLTAAEATPERLRMVIAGLRGGRM